jgi:DNA-binding transcriptional LysR family regulator
VVFGRLFVIPLVAEFLCKHPHIHAELEFNDRYVNLVDEGFDAAVRVGIPIDTSFRARKLADSRRRLVASPTYVKTRGRPSSPRDLKDHECLLHGNTSAGVTWNFRRAGAREMPTSVRGRVAANNSEAILHMARSGLGIALLADWLVERDLREKKLLVLLQEFEARNLPTRVRQFATRDYCRKPGLLIQTS